MKKLLILLMALSLPLKAATVTSTADDGAGSLREAIANAAAGETITFSVSGMITLTSGELLITNDLIILGPGATNLTVQRSTETNTPDFRIFNVQTGNVTISGLTMSNGREGVGGGINNQGTLALHDSVIQKNSAAYRGGGINNLGEMSMSNCFICDNSGGSGSGIFNWGTLTATSCTISNNRSSGWGGGIYNVNWGTLTITNSSIIGNSATSTNGGNWGGGILNEGSLTMDASTIASNSASAGGGGIANDLGTLNLVRSTVSENTAGVGWFGGGIVNGAGLLLVDNSTVSGNVGDGIFTWEHAATALASTTVTANAGGGAYNAFGRCIFKNSILAGNSGGADLGHSDWPGVGEPGHTESYGFNVIGSTNGMIVYEPSDQINVTAEMLRLGPLQDNGGPTFTHALLCGSVAINAGDSSDAPATDQRGFPRIMGAKPDIGAYEAGNQPGVVVNADGCSIEQLCPCQGSWRNHGDYVACVIAHAWQFYREGLISLDERQPIIRNAARSDCGKLPTDPERVRMHTQPQTPLEIRLDGFQFILSGDIPGGCVLESSTNLMDWKAIQTNQVASAEMEIADPDVGQASVRFYRVRLLP